MIGALYGRLKSDFKGKFKKRKWDVKKANCTCLGIHYNNIVSSSVKWMIHPINLDVGNATCTRGFARVVTAFTANMNI